MNYSTKRFYSLFVSLLLSAICTVVGYSQNLSAKYENPYNKDKALRIIEELDSKMDSAKKQMVTPGKKDVSFFDRKEQIKKAHLHNQKHNSIPQNLSKVNSIDTMQAEWVANYSAGLASPDDYGRDMVVDDEGNIYVTGESFADYLTIKYDSSGTILWTALYNGPFNSGDFPYRITLDKAGNVYVTGSSIGPNGFDYTTIKYSPTGVEEWVARYDGTGHEEDHAYDVAVDDDGNVYVTGGSVGEGENRFDYVTIKYNSSGIQQWVKRYDSGLNSGEIANALVLDESGGIYITGYSYGLYPPFINADFYTIKYNSKGETVWSARYNGDVDYADYIALDSSGNVYVAGKSNSPLQKTTFDYLVVKYNASGNLLWDRYYNGTGDADDEPSDLHVDGNGDVYVLGNSIGSGSETDITTVKYNSSGEEQWVARYNGPDNMEDYGSEITTDLSGNVYVAGSYYGIETSAGYITIKYNANGMQQWTQSYNHLAHATFDFGDAIALDKSGNIYVTGASVDLTTSWDFATIKYDNNGNQLWVVRYDGEGRSAFEFPSDMAVDESGNIYVTGGSVTGAGYDFVTVKYNPAGEMEWIARYDDPWGYDDFPVDIKVDAAGNVYVTGKGAGEDQTIDYTTIKYNSSGQEQWVVQYNGTGKGGDYPWAMALDSEGNLYVTGESYGAKNEADYTTVKYNPSGEEQWVARYNGPGNSDDAAKSIFVDNEGNVFITGESYGTSTLLDFATVKYNSSGIEQWVARYSGSGNDNDGGAKVLVDNEGNVLVSGGAYNSATQTDYITIKYNSSGTEQWVAQYDYANETEFLKAMFLDNSGNVYVTGWSVGEENIDYATVKYNSLGEELWVKRYKNPGGDNRAEDIAVDKEGNVYVTGSSNDDYATIKYNSEGEEQWHALYDGSVNGSDSPSAIKIDSFGNVIVTGNTQIEDFGSQFTTIKYKSTVTGITEENIKPQKYALYQNYPNPFNPSTTISFSLEKPSKVRLLVFDVQGRQVAKLVNDNLKAGTHEQVFNAENFSSGVYFYTLQANGLTQTKKLMLIK